ncbi:uncharacterized protein LOC129105526 [Anoplopoma fimbria]|uniref:uncharacterized protein LOC129105526 n=1 Tax=Anoplopoma fimbria TaxID=229290 RepID=UPI0023EB8271|nr:uncharacterized protein LOC129105526 [Anoplopoma fimbria]
MDSKRLVCDRISFVLLILGNIATALSGQNLDCTNDYESMTCHFEAQNCTGYKLTLRSNEDKDECTFKQCDVGQCCCSAEQIKLIWRETHNATVWKGDNSIVSKTISVNDSFKPKTPKIVSVNETNGNFQVKWKTNMEGFISEYLRAEVTYHKKGDSKEVSPIFTPTTLDGLYSYEILGRNLQPSTTYAVSVKSYTNISDTYSDSSEEWEFTTPMSTGILTLAIIISLSFAAVIITGATYVCYVKLKTKWWDTVAKCPNPKLGVIYPSEQRFLKPVTTDYSIACVEPLDPDDREPWLKGSLKDTSSGSPQQSSGFSIGSSCAPCVNTEPVDIKACVQDALNKAFANIVPLSTLTTKELNTDSGLLSSPYNPCDLQAVDMSCGSSHFDNKTYSIFIPTCPNQIPLDSSEVQTPAKMICDPAYRPSAGDIVTCVDPQAPAFPLVTSPPGVLSLMPTDMSYQQCNGDSGGFYLTEDSSLSSISSGTNTTGSFDPVSRVEARCESSEEDVCAATKQHGKTEGAAICDENPSHGCVPAGSHSFPSVEDDYQSFQNLVEKPEILFSKERSDGKEEHLNRYPEELLTKMPPKTFSLFDP